MNIVTETDFTRILKDHPWANKFTVLYHKDQSLSFIPHGFFRTWLEEEPGFGTCSIGKGSGFGVGSSVKYDGNSQKLVIGRFVAGGLRIRILLNGQHETRSISIAMMSVSISGMRNPPPPQYGDTIIKNDIWMGDETMILGGSTIENGCIIGARTLIPPNFVSEPYGIYVGTPAKLKKFRFSDKIREALIDLAWWDLPIEWIKEHNDSFLIDLTKDEGQSLETLSELTRTKPNFMTKNV